MNELREKLGHLYEHTPVLVAAYDTGDRLRYANAAFRAAFVVAPDECPLWSELMRRNFHAGRGTAIRSADFEAWLLSTQSRRGKIGYRAFETDLVDGRWLWMTETVQQDGWMLCIASNITSLRAEERSLRQARDFAIKAAHTDDLTGVANRRYVIARIEDMLRGPTGAAGVPGCVGVLDLDNFKYINDHYGHLAGDLILRDFARRIQEQVRRRDCFGRVGGEEFVLVFPDTSIRQARLLVEQMLATIQMSRPLPDLPDFAYSFSAGLAAGIGGESAAEVYARADKALYRAKMAGRNRILLEEPMTEQALG
ncbi:GGDEF domain-containing protein [Xanthobacter sp. DSM 24535]|uniref:GGDEF domain-containing protein n=1 Tax=Roseixanthobacter psychrophilus TaxID=3119917 RepID=UPI003727A6EF